MKDWAQVVYYSHKQCYNPKSFIVFIYLFINNRIKRCDVFIMHLLFIPSH